MHREEGAGESKNQKAMSVLRGKMWQMAAAMSIRSPSWLALFGKIKGCWQRLAMIQCPGRV